MYTVRSLWYCVSLCSTACGACVHRVSSPDVGPLHCCKHVCQGPGCGPDQSNASTDRQGVSLHPKGVSPNSQPPCILEPCSGVTTIENIHAYMVMECVQIANFVVKKNDISDTVVIINYVRCTVSFVIVPVTAVNTCCDLL